MTENPPEVVARAVAIRTKLLADARAVLPFFVAMRSQHGRDTCRLIDIIESASDDELLVVGRRLRWCLDAAIAVAHEGHA